MAAAAIAALAMAIPGVALAAHHHGHHARHRTAHRHHRRGKAMHNRRHHRARRRRGHLVRYSLATPLGGSPQPQAPVVPAAGSGAAGSAPTAESIGTVSTFEGGVLSIQLADGTVVTGKVTEETRLLCVSSEPPVITGGDDLGAGDDRGAEDPDRTDMSGGEGEEGTQGCSGEHGDGPPMGGDGAPMAHDSSFDGPGGGFFAPCESTALTPGTAVREAELRLGPEGEVWERVVLL